MSLTNTPSRQPKANPPLGREIFYHSDETYPFLPASAPRMEAWLPLNQIEQQPNFSLFEARTTDFYLYYDFSVP